MDKIQFDLQATKLSSSLADEAKFDTLASRTALGFFDGVNTGEFRGLPTLVWVGANRFRFVQDATKKPFEFIRSNGETVRPQDMFTDGGSVPRLIQPLPGFSAWDYGAAFIIHDWEFEAHHKGISNKSFDDVNLTLAEGIKTLMDSGIVEKNTFALYAIWAAVSSPVAKQIWDGGN